MRYGDTAPPLHAPPAPPPPYPPALPLPGHRRLEDARVSSTPPLESPNRRATPAWTALRHDAGPQGRQHLPGRLTPPGRPARRRGVPRSPPPAGPRERHGPARRGAESVACPADGRAGTHGLPPGYSGGHPVARSGRPTALGGRLGAGAVQGRGADGAPGEGDARERPAQGQRHRVYGGPAGHEGGGTTDAARPHLEHRRSQCWGDAQRHGLTLDSL
jgi:hypothetical protein